MSATNQTKTDRCVNCKSEFELPDFRGFCSEKCYYEHRGSKAMNLIKNDHRLCGSCFRRIKEVERPPDSTIQKLDFHTGESLVGFQYQTPNGQIVTKEFEGVTTTPIYTRGVGCECGITNTSEQDEDLQQFEIETVLSNFINVFRQFYEEGQIDQQIDPETFIEAYVETEELSYALGKGLYHDG